MPTYEYHCTNAKKTHNVQHRLGHKFCHVEVIEETTAGEHAVIIADDVVFVNDNNLVVTFNADTKAIIIVSRSL